MKLFPFELGKFYRHLNWLDVEIRVTNYWIKTSGNIGLTVEWWHKHGWPFDLREDITIRSNQTRFYEEIIK